jgi:hypothetical protein
MYLHNRYSFSTCVTSEYSVGCVQLLLTERKAGLEVLASAAVVKGPCSDLRIGGSAWGNEKGTVLLAGPGQSVTLTDSWSAWKDSGSRGCNEKALTLTCATVRQWRLSKYSWVFWRSPNKPDLYSEGGRFEFRLDTGYCDWLVAVFLCYYRSLPVTIS